MKRIWTILALIAILAVVAPASAQGPEGETQVYLVFMADTPVATYQGGVAGIAGTSPGEGAKVNARSANVNEYVQYLIQSHDSALSGVGADQGDKVYDYTFALNGFAARLTRDQAEAIQKQPGVVYVRPDELRHITTDSSPGFLGLTGRDGPWAKGITGEGVVVGIIDTGIWPEHPSFADDGSYGPPPGSVTVDECNFGNTAFNPNDAPFTCNNKLLGARQFLDTYKFVFGLTPDEYDSARDDDGHGTHTASTAAGNGGVKASIFGIRRGTISGMAPRARVIAYRACALQGCFTSDTSAAIDQAVEDGVDVINYSIGGGASLLGFDDLSFLFAADAGVFVATSAGNEGPGAGTVGGPASTPWVTAVGANTHNRTFVSDITLRGPGRPPRGLWGASVTHGIKNFNLVDAEGIADSDGDTSGMCLNAFNPGTFQADDAVLCNQYDFGVARTTRVANVAAGGGGAVIFHNSPNVSMTPTDNHPLPTVHMLNKVGQPLKDYLVAHPGQVKVNFDTSRARYAGRDRRVQANVLASFSSRGPDTAAMDIIKPDVTAPGISILAGASPIHVNTAAQGELFQAIMGTSMSSPHVAGVFALIKQAHPDWSPAMAKSALMTTAYRRGVTKQDGVTPADPFDIGAGHINPGGDDDDEGSAFEPGLVYDAGFFEYLGFLCDAAPEAFANPAATCASLAAGGIPTDASDLNLASIGVAELTGSQTVVRTVTSVAKDDRSHEYRVSVKAPPGYDVTVSPSTISLKQGEAASYSVTITNVSAPVGEWRFGSLTWTDRRSDTRVYSPIAVRASMFDAPAEVSGSGTSGSLSFDVKFGYTGSYAAAAHGLEPATLTVDNVVQDPDQNFDPTDGFSDVHAFNLSGAAVFRVAIPPEATEVGADLDVYVYNPGGVLVAASTLAGTDELVTIQQPADGTWQVYVHGWAAPGGDSDYTMSSWVVSATPGGSLSIDSAPGSATLGQFGTIQVSWSGLAPSTQYLGAVSHTGPSGLMGLTLVGVDSGP
jgi:subtilisin family serine protease